MAVIQRPGRIGGLGFPSSQAGMLGTCPHCGVFGDGKPGWLEDHLEICREMEVRCPCKIYGCDAMMPRWKIGSHLADCPACGVFCCFSVNEEQYLACPSQREDRPHVRVDWEHGGNIIVDPCSCKCVFHPHLSLQQWHAENTQLQKHTAPSAPLRKTAYFLCVAW